jgi:ATP-dependent Clp protease adaptor protein ClpS
MGNGEQLDPRFNEWMDNEEVKTFHLILHNDDVNTFEYVIESLVEVCRHDSDQAEQCAFITHYNGKCDVKSGDIDELGLLKDQLSSKGLTVSID